MNTPIINPWIFYFIELINDIEISIVLLIFLNIIAIIILIVDYFISLDPFHKKEKELKYLKKGIILLLLFCGLAIVIPGKETCYKMLIASNITPNNIETVKEEAKEVIDYMAEKIEETK